MRCAKVCSALAWRSRLDIYGFYRPPARSRNIDPRFATSFATTSFEVLSTVNKSVARLTPKSLMQLSRVDGTVSSWKFKLESVDGNRVFSAEVEKLQEPFMVDRQPR